MTTNLFLRDDLGQLEARLHRQLLVMSVLSWVLVFVFKDWTWACAAALGPLSAQIYFWALAQHTRRTVRTRVCPGRMLTTLSLAFRQFLTMLAPCLCLFLWDDAIWVCLATLLVSRHWVLVAAWPRQTQTLVPSV